MKSLIRRDFLLRQNYLKTETKIWLLKSIIADTNLSFLDQVKANFLLNKKLRKNSKIKIRNRCIWTAWAKSVLFDFWLSRMQFKEFASKGFLPGIKKKSH